MTARPQTFEVEYVERATGSLRDLALAIRHPGQHINEDANVAFWLMSGGHDADYHLYKIIREFEKLGPLVQALRARLAVRS